MESFQTSIKRFDFDDKIEGNARYCADIQRPDMLYARTLRSTMAHAVIKSITLPKIPKGYFIVDASDIPQKNIIPIVEDDQPFFAVDKVNYIGEPILLVVGPDVGKILDLMRQIKVEYQPLHPIFTVKEAKQHATDHPKDPSPILAQYRFTKGDIEQAKQRSKQTFEDHYETGYQEHAYLEPQSLYAEYISPVIHVHGSLQCPYYVHDALINALGWDSSRIRVEQLPTGGGFGGKEEFPSLPGVHCALASIKARKPVRLVYDRDEDIAFTTKRHPATIQIKSYLDEANVVIGCEVEIETDAGAYTGLSGVVLQRIVFSATGVYDIPNLRVTGKAYATNNVLTGAFRGFGGPQALFAIEMHMENIARILGVDPIDYKRSHFFQIGASSATGGTFAGAIKLDEITDTLLEISGYHAKRTSKNATEKITGIGHSVFFHGCGFTGAKEADLIHARVKLKKYANDTVEIFASSTEIGQGSLTTLRKIVANVLEIPVEHILHTYPNTQDCPDSGPTVASRTILIVGKLLEECAMDVKKRFSEPEFEIIRSFHYPSYLFWDAERLNGNAYPDYSWGSNVVEVEIDPLTYELSVTKVFGVYDIGTPIDVKIVQGQIEGGIQQGLGYATMENLESQQGSLRQNSLTTYMIPTSRDVAPVTFRLIENPSITGPFGARGLGELPLVGIAPAIASAVQDALGVKITRIPLTAESLLEAINHGN